jgi:ribose 5-phosphate isomerase A
MNLQEAVAEAWKKVGKKTIIGLGSGFTIIHFIEAHQLYCGNSLVDPVFIPTSMQAKALLDKHGLRSGDLNSFPNVEITVDGCDGFDPYGNLVKGLGGCSLQEKIVGEASNELVILTHIRKKCEHLFECGFPIEVHPLAMKSVQNQLKNKFKIAHFHVREGKDKMGPTITDSGNVIIDIKVDAFSYFPQELNDKLLHISGILDTGLFLGMHPSIITFQ